MLQNSLGYVVDIAATALIVTITLAIIVGIIAILVGTIRGGRS
jgi:hypothetical protein